jgi:hypothetical protein
VPVALGGGAVFRVRPATSTDVDYAGARAQRDLAGFAAGSEAASILEPVLGDGFSVGALKSADGLAAASVRLCEVYLVERCHDGWSGIATEAGEPIPMPDAGTIALLLADPIHRQRVMSVINAGVHEEAQEGNASAASPSGGAAIPDGAVDVRSLESPAPTESPSPETMEPEPAARSLRMPRTRARGAL